jgi:hypothetical protein
VSTFCVYVVIVVSIGDEVLPAWIPIASYTSFCLVVFGLALMVGLAHLSVRRRIVPYVVSVVGLVIWGWSSLLWTKAPNYGLFKAEWFSARCALPMMALFLLPIEDRRLNLNVVVGIMAVAGALRMYLFPVSFAEGLRYSSGGNPIWFARLMGLGILAVIGGMGVVTGRSRRWKILASVGLLALLSYPLIMAGSRGPLVSLAVTLVISVLGRRVRYRRLPLIIASVLLVALLLTVVAHLPAGSTLAGPVGRLFGSLRDLGSDPNLVARIDFARKGMNSLASMLVGAGMGSSGYILTSSDSFEWVHNVPLEILLELGLFAFLVFIFLVSAAFRRMRHQSVVSACSRLLMDLLTFTVLNSCMSGDLARNQELWVFTAAALSLETALPQWLQCLRDRQIRKEATSATAVQVYSGPGMSRGTRPPVSAEEVDH